MGVPLRFYGGSALACIAALALGYIGGMAHGYALWHTITPPALSDMKAELTVEEVSDGDTVRVRYGEKLMTVRMMGVDTPETRDARKAKQCFGVEAKRKTAELVGKKLTFEFIPPDLPVVKRDRYERPLVYIHLPDGSLYNEQLLKEGYAHQYTFRGAYKYRERFVEAQKAAQNQALGIWKDAQCARESSRER